jgi:hypothetical protein
MLNKLLIFLVDNPEIDPDRVRPGLMGLLSFLLLGLAVVAISYFLNRSIKKINKKYSQG